MERDITHKSIRLWGSVTVGSKGQVVIPAKARDELNIKEGDQLLMISPFNQSAIGIIRADILEKMLTKMQGNITNALNNLTKN